MCPIDSCAIGVAPFAGQSGLRALFVWLSVVLLSLLTACGSGGREPLSIEHGTLAARPALQPDRCGTWKNVELSVTVTPTSARDTDDGCAASDTHTFCEPIAVNVPASLETIGNTADASATLKFITFTGPGRSSDVTCRYGAGKGAGSTLKLAGCDHAVRAGKSLKAQKFALELKAKRPQTTFTARVQLSDGSSPPADAYVDILGTTQNLAGVTLHVPSSAVPPFSGVGLEDGPPFQPHAFVAGGTSGFLIAGPSVMVTGPAAFGTGVRLTVPFDAAFVANLPAGSAATLAVLNVAQVLGPREAIDATPLADFSVGADATDSGLLSPGLYLTGIKDLTPIAYAGGDIMDQGLTVYLIWAGDFNSQPEDPRPAVRQFLDDLNSTPWYDLLDGYGIHNRTLKRGKEISRSDVTRFAAQPDRSFATYTQAVKPAIDLGQASPNDPLALPDDPNGVYVVIAAPGVNESGPDGSYCQDHCGYHSNAKRNDAQGVEYRAKFAFVGHPKTCSGGCATSRPTPNGSDIDGLLSALAHEIVETVTNPTGAGWHGDVSLGYSANVENADKCAWRFTSVLGSATTADPTYNLMSNGHKYFVQDNWVNADGGYCAMGVEKVSLQATPLFTGGLVANGIGLFQVHVTNTGPVTLDANRLVVVGRASGSLSGDPVPVKIPVTLAPGASTDVNVNVQAPFEIDGNVQSVPFRFVVRDPSNAHDFSAEDIVNVDVQRAEVLIDAATCTLTAPATVPVFTWFNLTAHVHNAGTTKWLAGDYRLVALPLDVSMPNVGLPSLLTTDIASMSDGDIEFRAYAPLETSGQNFTLSVSMANAASAFQTGCTTTTLACDQHQGETCGACLLGTVQCDGSCSEPKPASCGCGGTIQCDGSCSNPAPTTACGCGGTIQCDGSCSVPTSEQEIASALGEACCGTPGGQDVTVFDGPCPGGHERGSCVVTDYSSSDMNASDCGASWASDDPFDCTCRMHYASSIFQSVHCSVQATIQYCN